MKNRIYCGLAIGIALATGNLRAADPAPAASAAVTNAPTPAQHALTLLKATTDKLSSAKAFTFKTHSMVEVPSPLGQMIDYFFTSEVGIERPNKLFSRKKGDGPAYDIYYDGKTFTGIDEKSGLYAKMDAPPTIDQLIPFVMEKTGIYFPSADVLYSDSYAKLTNGLTTAYWVGKSDVGGFECDHLAFAGPGIEWQIWIGPEKDPLPRRLTVTLLSEERQPRFFVGFSEWDFKSSLPKKDYEFKAPKGSKQIEFRPQMVTGITNK